MSVFLSHFVHYSLFSNIMECPSITLTAYKTRTAEFNFWDAQGMKHNNSTKK